MFMLYPFWLYSVVPHPGAYLKVLSPEEFQGIIDRFAEGGDYIYEQTGVYLDHREYYDVYGGMADGDVEKAVRIVSHPDYPKNVYNFLFTAYDLLEHMRTKDPEFGQMFEEEIADIRIGTYDAGIVVYVNPEYSNQKNFDRYENKIRELLIGHKRYITLTFEKKDMFDIRIPSGKEFFSNPAIMVPLFVFISSTFIIYFVKNDRI